MKKIITIYVCITILLYLSCDQIIDPGYSIDQHGIYYSVNMDIYRMDYDGSNQTQLTFDYEASNNPFISNDGRLLIYEAQMRIDPYWSGGEMYDHSIINVIDLVGGSIREIADENEWCVEPSLSPNDQLIVFLSRRRMGGNCIVLSDIHGREYKPLTDYGYHRNPIFTRHGDKIIYEIRQQDFGTNLYMIDLDGKNKLQLTDSDYNVNASLSPDGRKILWQSYWDINTMNLDGSNKVNISNHKNYDFSVTPSYSHKGDKIVFIVEKNWNVSREELIREIHIIDSNANNREIILKTGANYSPKFFPDDNKIFFMQYKNYQYDICTINIDGSDFRRLCKGYSPYVY